MINKPTSGVFEDYEQVLFFENRLFTGSRISFEHSGQTLGLGLSILVFGQGENHPLVKIIDANQRSQREVTRGFLVGCFVEINGSIELEEGRIVQGSSLALEIDGMLECVRVPETRLVLETPSKLPLL